MRHLFIFSLYIVILFFSCLGSAQTWQKVSAGGEFSVALRSDGTIWGWGSNGNGQLGLGNTNQQITPAQVGTDRDWADISAGAFHVIALKKDGSLWAWGFNGNGELGDGAKMIEDSIPEKIGTDNDWTSVMTTSSSSFALKKDGSLWGWGSNNNGTVGIGNTQNQLTPARIGTATDWLKISGGGFHVMALKKDHSLWGWGYNGDGELGFVSSIPSDSLPTRIGTETDWADISCGFEFSLGIKSDGTLWSWGFNGNGELGLGTTIQHITPQRVGNGTDWSSVAAGASFAFAMKKDGSLWAWGFNGYGNLGDGSTAEQDAPEQIGSDKDWAMISGAKGFINGGSVFGAHALGLRNSARTICAVGANYVGQLGYGSVANSSTFACSVGVISSVSTEISNVNISISPNPAQSVVTISVDRLTHAHLEMCNLLGEKMFESNFDHQIEWNAGSIRIANGVYLARITGIDVHGNRVTQTRQLSIRK